MKFMMLMMMNVSMTSPMMKHPITLGLILILQTMISCINMSMINQSSWYSYILFITIIGGMMIMFMYMASIASNEKFKLNKSMNKIIILMMVMMMINMAIDQTWEFMNKLIENKLSMLKQEDQKSTMKFFNLNKGNLSIMIMLTILLTMVSVTNISTTFEGPLKKTYV